jgi:hypothetical protein
MKNGPFLLVLILLFGFIGYPLKAQAPYKPVLEPGKAWKRDIGSGMGNVIPVQWVVTCDTVEYNGKFYALIEANEPFIATTENLCQVPLYSREDTLEKKIYYLPSPYEGEEEILYIDFNLEQGDTVSIYPSSIPIVVDTVRYLNYGGEWLRFIDFGCPPCDGFLEGYGLVMSGCLPHCDGWSEYGHLEYIFDCDETNDVDEAVSNETIQFYPNPVSDRLNILINDASVRFPVKVQIRLANGALLLETSLNSNNSALNLAEFPSGLLLLVLQTGEDILLKKVVKY